VHQAREQRTAWEEGSRFSAAPAVFTARLHINVLYCIFYFGEFC